MYTNINLLRCTLETNIRLNTKFTYKNIYSLLLQQSKEGGQCVVESFLQYFIQGCRIIHLIALPSHWASEGSTECFPLNQETGTKGESKENLMRIVSTVFSSDLNANL